MVEFSPFAALGGGILIGLAAALLLLANGRIAGIAGILGLAATEPTSKDTPWRLAFLAGLVTPALILGAMGKLPVTAPSAGLPLLLLAGFLVGFGARMGNGCTSGHGICGLARLSKRSAAAVGTFMAVAALAVFFVRHGV